MPTASTLTDAREAQQSVIDALQEQGMTVTRIRPASTDAEGNLVDADVQVYKAIQEPSREEKIHDSEGMDGLNRDNPDFMQWGFDYKADLQEGDRLVFAVNPQMQYTVTKVPLPQGIADLVILRVVECDRGSVTPPVEE